MNAAEPGGNDLGHPTLRDLIIPRSSSTHRINYAWMRSNSFQTAINAVCHTTHTSLLKYTEKIIGSDWERTLQWEMISQDIQKVPTSLWKFLDSHIKFISSSVYWNISCLRKRFKLHANKNWERKTAVSLFGIKIQTTLRSDLEISEIGFKFSLCSKIKSYIKVFSLMKGKSKIIFLNPWNKILSNQSLWSTVSYK